MSFQTNAPTITFSLIKSVSCLGSTTTEWELFSPRTTFQVADNFCISRDGRLATVNSDNDFQIVSDFLREEFEDAGFTSDFWIGLKAVNLDESEPEDRFRFLDGTRLNEEFAGEKGEQPWKFDFPNTRPDFDCVVWNQERDRDQDLWENVLCEDENAILCRYSCSVNPAPIQAPVTESPSMKPTAVPISTPTDIPTASPSVDSSGSASTISPSTVSTPTDDQQPAISESNISLFFISSIAVLSIVIFLISIFIYTEKKKIGNLRQKIDYLRRSMSVDSFEYIMQLETSSL